ncbi:hypothetical protein PAERUG_P58_London_29_09_13_02748 [Pseudomonas aeruginosa]|nr:hypothetical protein PAERUG_P39_London_29_08_12_00615 [Pseudomonas aeruginosa]CRR58763.1 hypothetical protein PAERUG_P58_London_29_09_13_02748 [Pseudomonas aeruginosa]CRX25327.1 hypothetical protein PAERUG_P54_1_London_24_VIM_2_04_13_04170 [Pseudomonas aeruginosa]
MPLANGSKACSAVRLAASRKPSWPAICTARVEVGEKSSASSTRRYSSSGAPAARSTGIFALRTTRSRVVPMNRSRSGVCRCAPITSRSAPISSATALITTTGSPTRTIALDSTPRRSFRACPFTSSRLAMASRCGAISTGGWSSSSTFSTVSSAFLALASAAARMTASSEREDRSVATRIRFIFHLHWQSVERRPH